MRSIPIALTAAAIFFAGCASGPRPATAPQNSGFNALDFSAPVPKKEPAITGARASLWDENRSGNMLFTDHKARRINDIVTIKIVEESTAKKDAETKVDRTSSIGAGLDSFFGLENRVARSNPDINMGSLIAGKTATSFDGVGETTRSGKLVATLTAVVVDVQTNGNLIIKGKRLIKVNNEEQIMILSGIVRPRDIGTDNSVLSTQIADARIEYTGVGSLGDKQKPGWFSRALDYTSPY